MSNIHEIERIEVCTLATGQALELFVHTITGEEAGPTLMLFGGIHGDEAMGVEGVRRVLEAVSSTPIKGKIVAVPVCNPLSFETMTRHTIQDGLNLNRIFPGDPNGSVTEQIAASLMDIQKEADYFIDFHSSGLYSTVDYAFVHEPGRTIAEAFGTDLLYAQDAYANSSSDMALRKGIPAMVTELGGGGQRTAEFLAAAVDGTMRVMQSIGLLAGEFETRPQTVMTNLATIRPRHGGNMLTEYGPELLGTTVPQGTLLGKVVSPYTSEVLEEFHAPFEPTILVLTREQFTRVAPGDYAFMVGDGGSTTNMDSLYGAKNSSATART